MSFNYDPYRNEEKYEIKGCLSQALIIIFIFGGIISLLAWGLYNYIKS